MKKILAGLLALAMLCGCSQQTKYPELKVEKLTQAHAADDNMQLAYPSESWIWMEGTEPLTFYWKESLTQSAPVTIQVQILDQMSGDADDESLESMMNSMVEAVESSSPAVDIGLSELRTVDEETVIYMEQSIVMDESILDLMLEQGLMTEESIEANGGRETLLSMPPVYSVLIYAVQEGELCVYVGTYYEEGQKEALLEAMPMMVQYSELL